MRKLFRIGFLAFVFPSIAVAAVVVPRALAPAAGGLWELSRSADGRNPTRMCVPSAAQLALFEHRNGRCTPTVTSDHGSEAVINYNCSDGGFGRSQVTLITPRTLRIDTQGISGNLPFHYQLHARRVGNCAVR
jgi:hypothetical protein